MLKQNGWSGLCTVSTSHSPYIYILHLPCIFVIYWHHIIFDSALFILYSFHNFYILFMLFISYHIRYPVSYICFNMYEALVRCLNIVLMWRSPLERRSIQRVRGFQGNDGWRLWWKVGGYQCPSHHIPTQDVDSCYWLIVWNDDCWVVSPTILTNCVVRSRSHSFIWWHCSALLSIRAQHHTQLRRALCRDFSSNWQARKKEWQRPGVGRRLKEAAIKNRNKSRSHLDGTNVLLQIDSKNVPEFMLSSCLSAHSFIRISSTLEKRDIRHHIPVIIIFFFPSSSSYMHHCHRLRHHSCCKTVSCRSLEVLRVSAENQSFRHCSCVLIDNFIL